MGHYMNIENAHFVNIIFYWENTNPVSDLMPKLILQTLFFTK